MLWKVVFYRVIAEFRARIQKAAAAGDKQREALRKVPHPATALQPGLLCCSQAYSGNEASLINTNESRI